MLISAFTIARNTDKLYFPVKASISSVLPIADEFIVALAKGDEDDRTKEIIDGIGRDKIKIIDRGEWDPQLFSECKIFAHETTFALNQCKGTWCLYIQADEVIHENDLQAIVDACKKYEHDTEVDGMLLNYQHFWGDYSHYVNSHGFYRNEIRIVRNNIGCYSYKDAVSFRKGNNEKLRVVKIPVRVYHYGHVRPPEIMGVKLKVQHDIYQGENLNYKDAKVDHTWGPLGGLKKFEGTHPAVMKDWIAKFNWAESLDYSKPPLLIKSRHKHLRFKYRFMTWLEENFNGNEEIFGLKNYRLIKKQGLLTSSNSSDSP